MPQIAQLAATYASQIFWLLLTFGFVFFVIGLGMLPRITATVDARDRRIAADLEAARAASERADALDADYRARLNENRGAAQTLVAQAKADAARATEQRVKAADQDVAAALNDATARIAGAARAAGAEIETAATAAAGDMVAKISGRPAGEAALRAAVSRALAHG